MYPGGVQVAKRRFGGRECPDGALNKCYREVTVVKWQLDVAVVLAINYAPEIEY
jgi:hypothetical protein